MLVTLIAAIFVGQEVFKAREKSRGLPLSSGADKNIVTGVV